MHASTYVLASLEPSYLCQYVPQSAFVLYMGRCFGRENSERPLDGECRPPAPKYLDNDLRARPWWSTDDFQNPVTVRASQILRTLIPTLPKSLAENTCTDLFHECCYIPPNDCPAIRHYRTHRFFRPNSFLSSVKFVLPCLLDSSNKLFRSGV